MMKQFSLTTALAVAGLTLGLVGQTLAQQRQQSQSYSDQTQRMQMQLPGAESILKIKAEVPQEIRVGDQVDYSIRVQNISDNVAVHNLKLAIKPQEGVTIESVQLKQQEKKQQKSQSPSQKDGQQKKANQQQDSQDKKSKKSPQDKQSATKQAQKSQQASSGSKQTSTSSDGSRQVTIEQLRPGQTRTIAISATAEKEGQTMACVMVTEFAPALCLTSKAVKPELEIAKSAPEKGNLCEPIEFEYFVKNSGSGDLKTFEVADKLPSGLQTESGEDHLNFKVDGGLKAGDVRKFVATLRATKAGEYSSRAVATTADGKTTRSSKTTTKIEQAQLAVAIDGPQTTLVNLPVSYQVRVSNNGNVPAENAVLRVRYPESASLRGAGEIRESDNRVKNDSGNSQPTAAGNSSSDQNETQSSKKQDSQAKQNKSENAQVKNNQQNSGQSDSQDRYSREWKLGVLEPGQTKQVSVTLSPRGAEELRTAAIAEFVCAAGTKDRMTSQATTTTEVISTPALLLTVIDNEQQRSPDGEITYTIEVRNQGTAADEQIEISAKLPDGMEFVDGSGETKVSKDGQQVKIAPVKKLGPDERARWQIHAKTTVAQQKQVKFRVELSSKSLNQQVTAEEPTMLLPASTQPTAKSSESRN